MLSISTINQGNFFHLVDQQQGNTKENSLNLFVISRAVEVGNLSEWLNSECEVPFSLQVGNVQQLLKGTSGRNTLDSNSKNISNINAKDIRKMREQFNMVEYQGGIICLDDSDKNNSVLIKKTIQRLLMHFDNSINGSQDPLIPIIFLIEEGSNIQSAMLRLFSKFITICCKVIFEQKNLPNLENEYSSFVNAQVRKRIHRIMTESHSSFTEFISGAVLEMRDASVTEKLIMKFMLIMLHIWKSAQEWIIFPTEFKNQVASFKLLQFIKNNLQSQNSINKRSLSQFGNFINVKKFLPSKPPTYLEPIRTDIIPSVHQSIQAYSYSISILQANQIDQNGFLSDSSNNHRNSADSLRRKKLVTPEKEQLLKITEESMVENVRQTFIADMTNVELKRQTEEYYKNYQQ